METEDDDSVSQCCDDSLVLIRVNVTDLGVQKCMQFHREELVWDVKQQLLATLQKELKESFNYGLYYPPANGKAGKFLDEERPLSDYPFSGPVGYLELKYKRRVYKMMNIDEKQLKQLHTKANLRRLLDFVQGGQAEKISKLCTKGLDPNFHCHETGETPLTLASVQKKCNRVILALANGGALLDFRTRDGCTALHRAVEKNNLEGIKTLLDLGASPNYKDVKGLTPLYSCVLNKADAHICEILLHDHATVGTADHQGWHEVHQACRNGLVQHLEHLLFYGADMNAKNASGNTPLHVCAVNEQESCARVLLFRGANKDALNFANQTPYQVAVIAGNLTLAEIIQNHSPEEVVPFREPPKYNPRRRASIASTSSSASSLSRTHSDPRLEITLGIKPPSPSPSNRSLPPFSSASSLSEASTGSSSTCTTQPSNDDSEDTASASIITEKSVASDSSSGVCCVTTISSYGTGNYEDGTEHISVAESKLGPGSMCVCVENYNSDIPGHLQLSQGDIIEVSGSSDHGLLEGQLKNQQGMFPASCVQEVRLRHIVTQRVEGRREAATCYQQQQRQNPQTQIISPSLMSAVNRFGEPRTVMLRKGKKGFGFVLRGAKATSPLMDMMPTDNCPALQYLDDVDKGGVADLAGLKKGDFLLTINGEDVSQASHEQVVTLIRKSGDLVAMTVVTVHRPSGILLEKPQAMATRQCATLPRKLIRAAPAPPRRDPRTTLSVGRARARSMVAGLAEIEALDRTLMEYDLEGRSNKSGSIESLPNAQQKRGSSFSNPTKGEAVNSLHDQFMSGTTNRGQRIVYSQKDASSISENDSRVLRSPKVYGSVAEMKRSRNHRQRITETSSSSDENKIHKLFSSTPDLNDNVDLNTSVITILNKENRKSHSQEDMHSVAWEGKAVKLQLENATAVPRVVGNVILRTGVGDAKSEDANLPWHSIEEIYERLSAESGGVVVSDDKRLIKDSANEFGHPPPPTHPPPPPPVGQVVRVDVSRSCGEYARITLAPETSTSSTRVMSSFRPGDSAKLYASPQEVCVVGYRPSPQSVTQSSRKPVSCSSVRSRSLPPNVPPPSKSSSPSSSTSSESETSGDSGGYTCSTFKKPCQQTVNVLDDTSTDSGNSSEKGSHLFDSGLSTSTNPYAQPVVSLHHPPSSISLSDGEPFIPEPDYDISDEDDDMTSRNAATAQLQHNGNLRAQPPNPPPLPLSAGGSVSSSKVSSHNPKLYGLHSAHAGRRPDDAMQRTPVSSGEKKKPPTPPVKRRDIKENVPSGVATTCVEGYPGGVQPSVNNLHCQLAAMPDSFNEKTSAGSNIQLQATSPISIAEHSAEERLEKVPAEIPTTFSTLRHIERRNSSGELKKKKDPPPVAWKPPPTGSKAVKSSSPVTVSSSPAASRAEVTEVSNLKQIIAQKAAERQRWASFTCDVPENAQEVVKEMDSQPVPSPVPKETEELVDFHLVTSSNFNQNNSQNQADDVVVNVKEQISVFEKKVESVKTSPYSVRASPNQKPEDSRKVLRGSRSQIFENKALDRINNANVKSSKSCPLDLAQDDVDDSSSGVSSDVDTHNDTFVRKEGREGDRMTKSIPKTDEGKNEELHPERTADVESDDSDDASDVAWNLRRKIYLKDPMMREDLEVNVVGRRILKKRVVSLTKLPPPIETGETDAESDVAESGLPSNEQSSNGVSNSTPLSTSTVVNSDLSKSSPLQQQMTSSPPPSDKALAKQDEEQKKVVEEEIQYSVKLIEMHANSLQEVNVLAGLVPPPPGFDERTGEEQEVDAIAPPPEFSDDVHVPISALQQRQRRRQEVLKLSEDDLDDSAASDLDEAEMAAKSAAAALAAAAGGIHLTCPSFAEWKSTKLHSRSSAPVSSLHAASGQQHYYQHYRPGQTASYDHHQSPLPQTFGAQPMGKTTAKSARKMVQQRPSNAKVRLLPADLQKGVSAACNGVRLSDEMQLSDSSERSMPPAEKLKMASNSVVTAAAPSCPQKEFRVKPMNQWTTKDVSDWLESLFLPEYKAKFEAAGVDGRRLTYLDEDTLLKLGVKRVGHRINIEQSLRRHSTMKH